MSSPVPNPGIGAVLRNLGIRSIVAGAVAGLAAGAGFAAAAAAAPVILVPAMAAGIVGLGVSFGANMWPLMSDRILPSQGKIDALRNVCMGSLAVGAVTILAGAIGGISLARVAVPAGIVVGYIR
jgi:hypothetical protein